MNSENDHNGINEVCSVPRVYRPSCQELKINPPLPLDYEEIQQLGDQEGDGKHF